MSTRSVPLETLVAFCDRQTRRARVGDFPGAHNGLQCANRSGKVTHIAAAVDAGLAAFERAAFVGADLLIVHHGLFWEKSLPFVGTTFRRVDALVSQNLALYGSHLPLDVHPVIGNNATLARRLGLSISQWELEYEGTPAVATVARTIGRAVLRRRLEALFPEGIIAIEKGPQKPKKIAIVTGSGASVVPHLRSIGVDTLVTGELRQAHYAQAEDEGLNLYCCGHYATEVFGVQNLAALAAQKFGLPCTWIPSDCPL